MLKIVQLLLPLVIFAGWLYLFFFADLTSEQKSFVVMTTLLLVLLERFYKFFTPIRNTGSVLLLVGPIKSISRFFKFWAAFFLFFVAVSLYQAFSVKVNLLQTIFSIVLLTLFALYSWLFGQKGLEFREAGINDIFGLIKWEMIESYSWVGPYNQTLAMKLRNSLFRINREWIISPQDGEAVNQILEGRGIIQQEQPTES